jgi:hypothetical protein
MPLARQRDEPGNTPVASFVRSYALPGATQHSRTYLALAHGSIFTSVGLGRKPLLLTFCRYLHTLLQNIYRRVALRRRPICYKERSTF